MPQAKQHLQKPIESFTGRIICGDSVKTLRKLPAESVDCVVTSPPYGALRDYGVNGQIGFGMTTEEYLGRLMDVFTEIRRVLKSSGTVLVNLGDSYARSSADIHQRNLRNQLPDVSGRQAIFLKHKTRLYVPSKSLCQIPARFALLMIERGWILRNEIIWHKPNAMPQSVRDRFTVDFEKIFFFVKNKNYYFNRQVEPLKNPERLKRRLLDPGRNHKQTESYWFSADPKVSEKRRVRMLAQGRNKRCVWTIGTANYAGNHFAVFPEKLVETPILAGCPKQGIVLDPFMGSGTTAVVAQRLRRKFIGIELNSEYVRLARNRLKKIK